MNTIAHSRFNVFHDENPEVYALFCRFTMEAIRSGQKVGAKAIIERIRWESVVVTKGSQFKINNSWTAYYARLFIADHPHHARFFEIRSSPREKPSSEPMFTRKAPRRRKARAREMAVQGSLFGGDL